MITIELTGGIGNQMFQAAFGLALKRRGYDVQYDILNYPVLDSRRQYLNPFGKTGTPVRKLDIEKVFSNLTLPREKPFSSYVWRKLHKARSFLHLPERDFIVAGDYSRYDTRLLELPKGRDVRMWGFFQNQDYFKDFRQDLLRTFQFPLFSRAEDAAVMRRIQEAENPVCVHIRRGDYLAYGLPVCTPDYYRKAMRMMRERVKSPRFFLFGKDCLEYATRELDLHQEDFEMVDIPRTSPVDDANDMHLMSLCRHFIIANSSFSWWAAWLSANMGGGNRSHPMAERAG